MNKFLLNYNSQEYLEIILPVRAEEMFYMDIAIQNFHTKDALYPIEETDILTILRDNWIHGLKEALDNKRKLPEITSNIGYIWNQIIMDKVPYYDENDECWWGVYYLLAEGSNKDQYTATWLYNNEKGEIIIEITEKYFWRYKKPSKGQKYLTYKNFMKNYKPLLSRVIPRDIAEQWLKQCEIFFEIISETEKKQKEHGKGKELEHLAGKCEECNKKNIQYGS